MATSDAETTSVPQSRYQVNFEQPLPKMDTLGGAAFACVDTRDASQAVYALIPRDGAAFRHHVLNHLVGRNTPHLICPLDALPVEIEDGGWVQAVILPFPVGGAMSTPDAPVKFSEVDLRSRVIPELVSGLQALASKGLTHRGIRPSRLFYMDQGKSAISLGECISEHPGQSQPLVFEPLHRSMAHECGRGEGDASDDMFALGVTILTLLNGQAPCQDLSDHDLMAARVSKGSYSTYLGQQSLRGAVGALLRGLLCDDPKQRWDLEKLRRWLDGAMPSEPGAGQHFIASSPYRFQSRDYSNRRLFAHALFQNFEAAIAEMAQPPFLNWLRSAIRDDVGSAIIEKTFEASSRSGERAVSRLNGGTLSRVIQLLDPEAPIRFRSLSFMIDGVGSLLAHAVATDSSALLRDFTDFFQRGYGRDVASLAVGDNTAYRRLLGAYSEVEKAMTTRGLGGGLELALYDLNPAMLCQSPLLTHCHVANMSHLMQALEHLATERPDRELLMDRHIAAFCAARWSDASAPLAEVARAETRQVDKVIASLKLYGMIQSHFEIGPLPGLAKHFAARLRPAVKDLYHKRTAELLGKKIDTLSASGELLQFHDALNFNAVKMRDRERYGAARTALSTINSHLAAIERGYKPTDPAPAYLGQKIAVGAAYVAAMASAVITFIPGI